MLVEFIQFMKGHTLSHVELPGVMIIHEVTEGREWSTGILIFVFSLLFEQLCFGVSRSICRLKGYCHLSNATLGFPPSSVPLDPQILRGFFISISHITWMESESLWEGGNFWKSKPDCVAHIYPLDPYWKICVVHSGSQHPTCKLLCSSHPQKVYWSMGCSSLSRQSETWKSPWRTVCKIRLFYIAKVRNKEEWGKNCVPCIWATETALKMQTQGIIYVGRDL